MLTTLLTQVDRSAHYRTLISPQRIATLPLPSEPGHPEQQLERYVVQQLELPRAAA